MDTPLPSSAFKTTRWSLVLGAVDDAAVLNELLREYWSPMYAFVRRSGFSSDDAADIVQDFVARRMIAGSLLNKADPERGRFRTLLKYSLRNFLTDYSRRERTLKRSPRDAGVLNGFSLHDFEPSEEDDPSTAFDRQWVAALLARTLDRVRKECEEQGQLQHWKAFEQVVLVPAVSSAEAVPLADVARIVGAESAHNVSSMVQTVHRKFRRLLRGVIEETVSDPRDAEQEFLDLRAYLK